VLNALAAIEASDLVGDRLRGAVRFDEIVDAGIKDAGGGIFEKSPRRLGQEFGIKSIRNRFPAAGSGNRPIIRSRRQNGPKKNSERHPAAALTGKVVSHLPSPFGRAFCILIGRRDGDKRKGVTGQVGSTNR